MSQMNRRAFGQLLAGAGLASGFPSLAAAPAPAGPRFSVMLWTIEKQVGFDRAIEQVAAAGYQGVELIGDFQKWSPQEATQALSKMRSLGLVFDLLSGVKPGFADPAGTDEFIAAVNTQMTFAERLEAAQINLKSGNRIDGVAPAAQHQAAIENLKRAADIAGKNNVQIVIEPIDLEENPKMYMTSVSEAFSIVEAVGSPQVRVLYDFYHEQRGSGNLIEKLEAHIDLVGLVHIADVPGRHQPGTGEIDYANIYKKLAQLRYDKFITMEFYPDGDPVATLRKAREEAQKAMAASS